MRDEKGELTKLFSLLSGLHSTLKDSGKSNALAANEIELYSRKDLKLSNPPKSTIKVLGI